MWKPKLQEGDAVKFEYRDTYDRETGTGIVVKQEENGFYRVVLIMKEGKDDWWFTNYEASLPESRLRPVGYKVEDYGLSLGVNQITK